MVQRGPCQDRGQPRRRGTTEDRAYPPQEAATEVSARREEGRAAGSWSCHENPATLNDRLYL